MQIFGVKHDSELGCLNFFNSAEIRRIRGATDFQTIFIRVVQQKLYIIVYTDFFF